MKTKYMNFLLIKKRCLLEPRRIQTSKKSKQKGEMVTVQHETNKSGLKPQEIKLTPEKKLSILTPKLSGRDNLKPANRIKERTEIKSTHIHQDYQTLRMQSLYSPCQKMFIT